MLPNRIKRLISENTPNRIRPLLRGVYNTIFYENEKSLPTNPYEDAQRVLELDSPTIVDGGAHEGRMIERFLNLFPDSTIHAFEPLPQHVNILKTKFGNNRSVFIHDSALGDSEVEIEINANPKSSTSSVFETTRQLRDYKSKHSSRPSSDYVPSDSVTVQQVRMDSEINACDIIKLDLQGYELNALHGAEKLLPDCKAIITEISFVPYYQDQPLFGELHQFFTSNDFRLYNIYANSGVDGQISHGDAIYFHKSVYANEAFSTNWFPEEG